MYNTKSRNDIASRVISNITEWHMDRNLIEGTDDWNQTKKLFEEFIEVVAAQMPAKEPEVIAKQVQDWTRELLAGGRIKSVPFGSEKVALKDAIGDMGVVAINLAERNIWTYADCLHGSYLEIKDRKGKMIDGCYVKEADLKDEDK